MYSPKIESILADLVAFPTISHTSNLELIEYVGNIFESVGGRFTTYPGPEGRVCCIGSIGPQVDGGLGLSGHSDVVPVAGQKWDSDPFLMQVSDDKVIGRGVCDMKGFSAVVLAKLPEWSALPLTKPIHLILTYDEEVGCVGAHDLVQKWGDFAPSTIIVGEPSNLSPLSGHKGVKLHRTVITGWEVHSSQPQLGVSAVEVATTLIQKLRASFPDTPSDPHFSPAASTLSINQIQGGNAHNITAGKCEFLWEVRYIPSFDVNTFSNAFVNWYEKGILPDMRAVNDATAISTELIAEIPPMDADDDSEAERVARRITGNNARTMAPFGTEAGIFQKAGLATIIMGPGSIDQAHQPNEWLKRTQLTDCAAILDQAVRDVCCS